MLHFQHASMEPNITQLSWYITSYFVFLSTSKEFNQIYPQGNNLIEYYEHLGKRKISFLISIEVIVGNGAVALCEQILHFQRFQWLKRGTKGLLWKKGSSKKTIFYRLTSKYVTFCIKHQPIYKLSYTHLQQPEPIDKIWTIIPLKVPILK